VSTREQTKRLQGVADAIRQRWGNQALRTLNTLAADIPHVSTQFRALDRALGVGGLPRGRLTELLGVPTSGVSTLAFKVIASAQSAGDMAVYIDIGRTLDPDYAVRCGVCLDKLLVVHPPSGEKALDIARDLVASGGAGILVFGAVFEPSVMMPPGALERLNSVLSASPCVLIYLSSVAQTDSASSSLAYYASVRLLVAKARWLYRQQDVRGYRAKVTVVKNKLAPPGRSATITIGFSQTVRGDGT
jgi:recombination protein RecA